MMYQEKNKRCIAMTIGLLIAPVALAEDMPTVDVPPTDVIAPNETDNQAPATIKPDVNPIVIVNRPLIAGLWEMNIPGARCKEYYNFMENGEMVVKSDGEWTYGNYVYQLPALGSTSAAVLAMKIKYDNLETDCSGNAIDQRGEEQQQYVKWLSQSSIEFCATADGKQCFADLRRISP